MTTRSTSVPGLDSAKLRTAVLHFLATEGWSRNRFAITCDPQVDPSNLSKFLRGEKPGVSAETAAAMANVMRRPPADFYNLEPEPASE